MFIVLAFLAISAIVIDSGGDFKVTPPDKIERPENLRR